MDVTVYLGRALSRATLPISCCYRKAQNSVFNVLRDSLSRDWREVFVLTHALWVGLLSDRSQCSRGEFTYNAEIKNVPGISTSFQSENILPDTFDFEFCQLFLFFNYLLLIRWSHMKLRFL